jgi:hypothetical protein
VPRRSQLGATESYLVAPPETFSVFIRSSKFRRRAQLWLRIDQAGKSVAVARPKAPTANRDVPIEGRRALRMINIRSSEGPENKMIPPSTMRVDISRLRRHADSQRNLQAGAAIFAVAGGAP